MAAQSGPGASSARPAGSTSVRRPSAAVYRRRRIVAALLALVLLTGLIAGGFAAAALIGSALAAGPSETSENQSNGATGGGDELSDERTTESTAGKSSAGPGCAEQAVKVRSSTDQREYAAEENPVLVLEVENSGEADCVVNVGTSQMELLITSGSDRIFSSRDCQIGAKDNYLTLKAGQSEKAVFDWQRNRTAPSCDPMEVKPKPGVYVLVAKLGERTGNKAVFELN